MDYALQRKKMIEEQLIPRGISDKGVLKAFQKVERHKFVPGAVADNAYSDYPLPIGENQTISQPYIVALMTEALQLTGKEKVLEIGAGSGYQAAILAELTKEVYTIERFESLTERARKTLIDSGYANIKIKTGDGTLGWPQVAPFDRILVAAAGPCIPQPLTEQLKSGGILVMPVGGSFSQVLTKAVKTGGKLRITEICSCVFVPLSGKHGM
jgi:protein-L-isoaspartate(D-aspartate) O-methyltransferase